MNASKAQKESVIGANKQAGNYTLYPAKFGIIEWLQSVRKNPAITQIGNIELKHIGELCFAFTRPSSEITGMTQKQIESEVRSFMDELDADIFHTIQSHAESELAKFYATKTAPKKKVITKKRIARKR